MTVETQTPPPLTTEIQIADTSFRNVVIHYRNIREVMSLHAKNHTDPDISEVSAFLGTDPDPFLGTIGRVLDIRESSGFDPRHYVPYQGGSLFMLDVLRRLAQQTGEVIPEPTPQHQQHFAQRLIHHQDGFLPHDQEALFATFLSDPTPNTKTIQSLKGNNISDVLSLGDALHVQEFAHARPELYTFIRSKADMFLSTARGAARTHQAVNAFIKGCVDTWMFYDTIQTPPPYSDVHPEDALEMSTRILEEFKTIHSYMSEDRFVKKNNRYNEVIILNTDPQESAIPPEYAFDYVIGTNVPIPHGITEPFWMIGEKKLDAIHIYEDTPFGTVPNIGRDTLGNIIEISQTFILDSLGHTRKVTTARHLREAEENLDLTPLPLDTLLEFHEYDPKITERIPDILLAFPDTSRVIVEGMQQTDYDYLFSTINDFAHGQYIPKSIGIPGFGEDE